MDALEITQLLQASRSGEPLAFEQLTPVIYKTLKELAGAQMRRERADHTLQATALVNEAYLKLLEQDISWQDRAHFRGVAARIMRNVLIDHARAANSQKRGRDIDKVTILESRIGDNNQMIDLLELDEILTRLAEFDERKAKVIELSFFGGLSYEEIAEVLDISVNTVDRDLRRGKSWLQRELNGD
jgi:RNA polymerase sigma factor (TIGR02999 family)